MTDPIEKILKEMNRTDKEASYANKTNCLDDETTADYFEGRLPHTEKEVAERHLAACSRCRQSLIIFEKVSEAGNLDPAQEINGLSDKVAHDFIGNVKAQLEGELNQLEKLLGIKPLVSSSQESPCIMIVDDDSHYLSSLTDTLSQDFSVIPCLSADEAITKISPKVGIIVLDIRMPVLNGLELARYFRKRSLNTPIIFNTGYPGDYPESSIVNEIGSAKYVTKDNPSQLISFVQQFAEAA